MLLCVHTTTSTYSSVSRKIFPIKVVNLTVCTYFLAHFKHVHRNFPHTPHHTYNIFFFVFRSFFVRLLIVWRQRQWRGRIFPRVNYFLIFLFRFSFAVLVCVGRGKCVPFLISRAFHSSSSVCGVWRYRSIEVTSHARVYVVDYKVFCFFYMCVSE